MKFITALLMSLVLATTASKCDKKDKAPATENAEVVFTLHVYDEEGFVVRTDTEDVAFFAEIIITGIPADPGTPENPTIVTITDPETGGVYASPYEYSGKIPHRSYQQFGPGVIGATFNAAFLLFPHWKMECKTTDPVGNVIHQVRSENDSDFPFEKAVTCLWP